MIVSISPHIITQNKKKVKSFLKKCLKNINGRAKKMLEKGEKRNREENI